MSLRLLGGIMVVISSSIIGFIIANSYHERPVILKKLQIALSMLETEMSYGHTPLPQALENVGGKCGTKISKLFFITRHNLISKKYTASEAWEEALDEICEECNLLDVDLSILTTFGKYLGSTNREDQIKNIKLTISNLRQQEAVALEEKQQNEKLWRYLGVLSGIMIFLLLY